MLPKNLTIIETTNSQEISDALKGSGLHFTNGVYSYEARLIVPTTLAGFRYISEKASSKDDVFVIAVNSDISINGIYDRKKEALDARDAESDEYETLKKEKEAVESQQVRAEKVAIPLAQLDPERKIIVVFYDTETPTPLYNEMYKDGLNMKSLHKWGYGTNPDQPRIEGADNFTAVLGFPLLNDVRPVCHEITKGSQTGAVIVKKLHEEVGSHKQPYISETGKVLFPVNHPELAKYHQDSLSTARAPIRKLKL
ncbi:MAG: hypothetical protein KAS59_06705 [Alphaproteobacteria bacterium]|nr:hypothetical protein [Alphaproteobacteria bacterium]